MPTDAAAGGSRRPFRSEAATCKSTLGLNKKWRDGVVSRHEHHVTIIVGTVAGTFLLLSRRPLSFKLSD